MTDSPNNAGMASGGRGGGDDSGQPMNAAPGGSETGSTGGDDAGSNSAGGGEADAGGTGTGGTNVAGMGDGGAGIGGLGDGATGILGVGNGDHGGLIGGLGDSAPVAVSADAGPLSIDAGGAAPNGELLSADLGNGGLSNAGTGIGGLVDSAPLAISADAGPLSIGVGGGAQDGRLVSADGGNGGDLAHVGAGDAANPLDLTGLTGGGAGGHSVTADAGAAGGPTLADAGILTAADGQSPLGAEIGNGGNVADASLLGDNTSLQNTAGTLQGLGLPGLDGGSNDHSLIATGGASDGAPVADAGLLTTPDSQAPVAADIGNGDNLANAGLLPNSDALSFPNLGGTGTDALTGLVPTGGDLGNLADLGNVASTSPATGDQSLVDAHTDGAPIAQVHDNSATLVGVNDHALV